MEIRIGKVIHYFNRIGVAVLDLNGELQIGDTILIIGHTTDFIQHVWSMEVEHQKIPSAGPGMEVALKVSQPARKGDEIYKVIESQAMMLAETL